MNDTEAYSLLFVDNFTANLIFGFGRELVLYTMKIFGTYNYHIMLPIATVSAACANCINYLFGKIFANILNTHSGTNTAYQKIAKFYTKYDTIILLLTSVPLWGSIVALMSGTIKINFFRFLAIGTLAKACYYAAVLYLL